MSGFRFYRRIKIVPGLKLNISKRGASLTVGSRRGGPHVTVGNHGTTVSAGLPGTGASYRKTFHLKHSGRPLPPGKYSMVWHEHSRSYFVTRPLRYWGRRVRGPRPGEDT